MGEDAALGDSQSANGADHLGRITTDPPMNPDPSADGILLCLSGGGYRAAAFHLGVLRRLQETGVLDRTSKIRSVSGGSILAGHLAGLEIRHAKPFEQLQFESEVAAPFRELLRRDIRTSAVVTTLPINWW